MEKNLLLLLQQLDEKIQTQLANDHQRIEQLMLDALQTHATALKQLSSDVLHSISAATKSQIQHHLASSVPTTWSTQSGQAIDQVRQSWAAMAAVIDSDQVAFVAEHARLATQSRQAVADLRQEWTDLKTAIAQQQTAVSQSMLKHYTSLQAATDQQSTTLQGESKQQTRRMVWLLRIPIVTGVGASLICCLSLYGWAHYELTTSRPEVAATITQAEAQLAQLKATTAALAEKFCATPAGKRNCK